MSEPAPIVLVVDDEIQIRRFLRTGFELNGFVVHEAGTGAEAIRSATLRPIDLVIVDLGLPDMDGSEVVERIRSWSSVPIIILSVRSTEAQKVSLLELGADDYVVKPFGMAELLARVRVALRRQMRAASGEPTVRVGPLVIDLAVRAVTLNDKRLTLTPKEYRLLQVLAQHAGNVVTHQPVSYTHLRAHETRHDLVCRLLLEKKKTKRMFGAGQDLIKKQKKINIHTQQKT